MNKQFSIDGFKDHTSGLWTVEGEMFDDMEIHAVLNGELITGLWRDPDGSWLEVLANFRLIAAAPQLLQLAKSLRNKVKFLTLKILTLEEQRDELQVRVILLEGIFESEGYIIND